MNRTVLESARSMLHAANLPTELWAEAVNCAVYLQNRVAVKGTEKTPYQVWKGVKPNVSHLRVFGSTVFVQVPRDERAKFDRKANKCIHVGYCETRKAFRAWDPVFRKLRISRDVVFDETVTSPAPSSFFDRLPERPFPGLAAEEEVPDIQEVVNPDEAGVQSDDETHPDEAIEDVVPIAIPVREQNPLGPRVRKPIVRWADESLTSHYAGLAGVDSMEPEEPSSFQEALGSPDSSCWRAAMEEEVNSLLENNT